MDKEELIYEKLALDTINENYNLYIKRNELHFDIEIIKMFLEKNSNTLI